MNEEIKNIAKFWVNNINTLVNRINMAALNEEVEEMIEEYKSMLKIQPESSIYSKFNKVFEKIAEQVRTKFIFDYDKSCPVLLPDLKKSNYDQWQKERFELIDQVNKFKREFDLLVEKNIKAKISVEGVVPTYDKIKQAIFFGEQAIVLERDSLENAFCLVLFNEMTKEQSMSWDEFWEKMSGGEGRSEPNQKQVYDVHYNLSKKIKRILKNKQAVISEWKNKNIVRVF
jgi:hypothetical protein